jgi:oxygen-dependent protoporphyrinogen oxidase
VFFGGIRDGTIVEASDDEIVALARRELGGLLGLRGEPVLVRVFRWERATPQMELGHADRLARVERGLARVPGVFLTGGGLRGTGLPDTIGDAQRTATRAAAFVTERTRTGT